MIRTRSSLGLPVAAVLLLSACGSTVANNGAATLGGAQPGVNNPTGPGAPVNNGLGGPAVAPGGTTGGTTGGASGGTGAFSGSTGGAPGAVGTTGSTGSTGTAGSTGGGTTGASFVAGPGVTATT